MHLEDYPYRLEYGTGNIVGVATAISLGGPGALLWMWLTGVFGIATKYGEALLAVKYRTTTPKGQMAGGPMYVLEKGMNAKWLAIIFAVFTAVAAFGIGNMIQSHSIAEMMNETFQLPLWVTGLILAVLTAAVILFGIRGIARVCEVLVPFMVVVYLIGCLVLLVMHAAEIPSAIALVCKSAFSGHSAVGGFAGVATKEAVRFGIARGLFSNESGMGSAPIVAAAAQTTNPVRQALVSASATFWDTVIVCAITGLVLITSGRWTEGLEGAALSKAAFEDLPLIGPTVLTIALLTFVFSTILGWSYYGEKAVEYLFGSRVIVLYRILWVGGVMIGSVLTLKLVWTFSDLTNALMAVPNLIALIVLSGVIASETKKYIDQA